MDLNSDLGEIDGAEGRALDEALLSLISSANVACGGHAGDDASMHRICDIAVERGVAIGAQVSYVDRANFGRVRLDVAPTLLTSQLREQIHNLQRHAVAAGDRVRYIKPHGALYHAASTDPAVADAVVAAIDFDVPILTAPDGHLVSAARAAGVTPYTEAFADRGYLDDGRLVPRDQHGALLTDLAVVRSRVTTLLESGVITSRDGTAVPVEAVSICVHCDTPGAVDIARAVRQAIEACGEPIRPFTHPADQS